MTNYNLKPITLPSFAAQEAKAQRKQLLDEVRKRRYRIEQERRKRQQQAYNSNEEYKEYQDMLKACNTSS